MICRSFIIHSFLYLLCDRKYYVAFCIPFFQTYELLSNKPKEIYNTAYHNRKNISIEYFSFWNMNWRKKNFKSLNGNSLKIEWKKSCAFVETKRKRERKEIILQKWINFKWHFMWSHAICIQRTFFYTSEKFFMLSIFYPTGFIEIVLSCVLALSINVCECAHQFFAWTMLNELSLWARHEWRNVENIY